MTIFSHIFLIYFSDHQQDEDHTSSTNSTPRKKKRGGPVARLKTRQNQANTSQISLQSQEVKNLRDLSDDDPVVPVVTGV